MPKREGSGSKNKITSANISSPAQNNTNAIKHIKTVPVRNTSHSSQHSNSVSRSSSKNFSVPEKAIKALYSYQAQSPKELSFLGGDFFYVKNEEQDWYNASNPSSGKQGMVPKSYFEVVDRSRPRSLSGSARSRHSEHDQLSKMGSLYAIVLYDFQAEKSDELTAHAGENLFICAHHNYEWFIAKPIGRLGGPGLVPVGFVSIVDIGSGYATGNEVKDDITSVSLPTVQEWKGYIAKYKASNISLGSVEQNPPLSPNSRYTKQQQELPVPPTTNNDFVTKASVEAFGLEEDKYWFEVNCEISSGKRRKLKRYYQDFYDLQVKLLDSFPAESGKLRDNNGQWTKRIMPYIPGPVPYVTDVITKKRKDDLNVYVGDLIMLPEYISRSTMVRSIFMLRDNGFDHDNNIQPINQFQNNGKDDDTAVISGLPNNHLSARNNEDNTLTGEDLKLYEKLSELSLSSSKPHSRPPSTLPPQIKPTKIKFYYKDDIFALMLNSDITLNELYAKIAPRIDSSQFRLFIKMNDSDGAEIISDPQVSNLIQSKMKISVYDL